MRGVSAADRRPPGESPGRWTLRVALRIALVGAAAVVGYLALSTFAGPASADDGTGSPLAGATNLVRQAVTGVATTTAAVVGPPPASGPVPAPKIATGPRTDRADPRVRPGALLPSGPVRSGRAGAADRPPTGLPDVVGGVTRPVRGASGLAVGLAGGLAGALPDPSGVVGGVTGLVRDTSVLPGGVVDGVIGLLPAGLDGPVPIVDLKPPALPGKLLPVPPVWVAPSAPPAAPAPAVTPPAPAVTPPAPAVTPPAPAVTPPASAAGPVAAPALDPALPTVATPERDRSGSTPAGASLSAGASSSAGRPVSPGSLPEPSGHGMNGHQAATNFGGKHAPAAVSPGYGWGCHPARQSFVRSAEPVRSGRSEGVLSRPG